jgi:hypothetical protein
MLSRRLVQSGYKRSIRSQQLSAVCQNSRDDEKKKNETTKRSFHATPKNEVLPLIAAGGLVMIGRWSWKALKRMDEEWDDHLWQLQNYERERRKNAQEGVEMTTIGVDVGSLYLKLSTLSHNKPDLVTTTQGDRYRFTGILASNDETEELITGAPALEKFFYQPSKSEDPIDEPVILPYRELQKASHEEAANLVQKVFVPAIGEAMERLNITNASGEEKSVRTVLTLPPIFYNQHGETIFQNYHDDSHYTTTVPDPVAAIWGAQVLDLIPTPSTKEESTASTLVVDVGGLATTVSLVRKDIVVASCTLENIGGESFVQQLVARVLKETEDETLNKDAMCLSLIQFNARSSILELVNKTQANVHIPFLFMGRKPNDPHLDMNISRTVLEQAVQDAWASEVIPKLVQDNVLSSSLPTPTNAASLMTSAITRVLEDSEEIPTNIQHILLVGGGSKHKLLETACKEGIDALMGPSSQKLILPESSLRAEITVLGASSLLPNFDYSYDNGLERI